jgi:hypothetical protein
MKNRLYTSMAFASTILTGILTSTLPAMAQNATQQNAMNGTWIIDAKGVGHAGGEGNDAYCPRIHLIAVVKNGVLNGDFLAVPNETAAQSTAPIGRQPITGTVDTDGTVNARYQSLQITGKITGDTIQLGWTGECGPRTAMGKLS